MVFLLVKTTSALRKLGLRNSDMRPADAAALAEALEENQTINYLDLRQNKIADKGCERLADLLMKNKSLQYLDLQVSST